MPDCRRVSLPPFLAAAAVAAAANAVIATPVTSRFLHATLIFSLHFDMLALRFAAAAL